MNYEGIVYRPPSEANSLIIQVTIGCSYNKCTFCSMYKNKTFKIKDINSIKEELKEARILYKSVKRIFLADGDAFILKTSNLIDLLQEIKKLFPECERISSYATPRAILTKSEKDIKILQENGLKMLYVGIESGNNKVLENINKGITSDEIITAGKKAIRCNMILSVTLISGLGGINLWKEHAIDSAHIVSAINPHYIGLLTLMVEKDTVLQQKINTGEMILLTPKQILEETYEFINNLNVSECIFRSNHASNYVSLSGSLNKDKKKILQLIDVYISEKGNFKDERYRSL